MSGNEVRMQMALHDVANGDPLLRGSRQIQLDIPLRVDHHAFAFGSQQVRGMRQASQIELFEVQLDPASDCLRTLLTDAAYGCCLQMPLTDAAYRCRLQMLDQNCGQR